MKCNCTLSFIIPTYNEEDNIGLCIEKIVEFVSDGMDFEVIVVDHGSHDKTVDIALKKDVKVICQKGGTVAALRNKGADLSSNDVLIFLDADVLLTPGWQKRFAGGFCLKVKKERLITGSWVGIGSEPSWIEKYWFEPLQHRENSHINSGHLIISKKIFMELGGFNEDLETGEDYELSFRAKRQNVKLVDDLLLKVTHEGFPKTLGAFFLREMWHGKGDFLNAHIFFKSKVAMVSIVMLFLHLGLIGHLGMYFLIAICSISFFSSLIKYRTESVHTILVNSFLYYIYYMARGLSIFASLFQSGKRYKHMRNIK